MPTIDASDVSLDLNETFQWTFSGLNVNVSECHLDSIRMIMKSDSWLNVNDRERLVENPQTLIHNSSFGSLDLEPGTKALITKCFIDAEFKLRATLITTNNSDVSIQNSHFENFINKNGSTILFGHNNSQVTIENSVFIQHNSSKGILLLQNNSSLHLSGLLMSHNLAFTLGYSSITLKDGIHAVTKSTTFKNNSALAGGVMNAENQCQVVLINCTLSSNKATTGKTPNIPKISNPQRTSLSFYGNETYKPINPPTLFNLTSSRYLPRVVQTTRDPNKTRSSIRTSLPLFDLTSHTKKAASHRVHLKVRSFTLKKNSSPQKDVFPGFGGTVNIAVQSYLLVTNCVFENNSAQRGGGIAANQNGTLDIQGTTFVSNTALKYGGAIYIQEQAHLRITNCVFEDNTCQQLGGAIDATDNITLDIHKTNFTRNSAVQGGAIDIDTDVHLRATHCTFNDNYAGQDGAVGGGRRLVLEINGSYFSENSASGPAGAIIAIKNVTLDIQGTTFVGNKALDFGGAIGAQHNATLTVRETSFVGNKALNDAGAIDVEHQAQLRVKNCVFDENVAQNRAGGAINGAHKCNTRRTRNQFYT